MRHPRRARFARGAAEPAPRGLTRRLLFLGGAGAGRRRRSTRVSSRRDLRGRAAARAAALQEDHDRVARPPVGAEDQPGEPAVVGRAGDLRRCPSSRPVPVEPPAARRVLRAVPRSTTLRIAACSPRGRLLAHDPSPRRGRSPSTRLLDGRGAASRRRCRSPGRSARRAPGVASTGPWPMASCPHSAGPVSRADADARRAAGSCARPTRRSRCAQKSRWKPVGASLALA